MFYDPRGHMVRTINPDGSEQRVIYGVPGTRIQPDLTNPDIFEPHPWESYVYDVNDNAGRTHPVQSAAYQQHWNTPNSSLVDALGRVVRTVVRNGSNAATDWFAVSSTYDISGNLIEATDELGRVVARTVYDLSDRPLRTATLDDGEKVIVMDAAGSQIECRDSKGALTLNSYDALNRAIRIWARDDSTSALTLRQRMVYGDHLDSGLASPQSFNLLGKLFRHYDEAGLVTNELFDFKGNNLESVRQVVKDSEILNVIKIDPEKSFQIDWQPAPGTDLAAKAGLLLDLNTYRTSTTFDAMNRIQTMLYPLNDASKQQKVKRSELRARYNRAGALEQLTLDGAVYVKHVAYNAKGDRTLIAYGNGVLTRYAYDPLTFRLSRLRSENYSSPAAGSFQPAGPALQDCGYTYDLIGNVLQILDRTPGSGVLNNPEAVLVQDSALAQLLVQGNALIRRYSYDPIYRLLSGSGRECSNIPAPRPWSDDPRCGGFTSGKKPGPPDNAPSVTSIYQELYSYDPAGNMLTLKHVGKDTTWVRNFGMGGMTPQQWAAEWPKHLGPQGWTNPPTNRLTHVGDNQTVIPQTHTYDACGNLTSETTSRRFDWDHSDRLRAFRVQPPRSAASIQAQYLYDSGGQRVKKLVLKQDGSVYSTVYVGGMFEHHAWSGPSGQENIRLHVMDNQQRIAMVRVGPAHPSDQAPDVQFQLGDHLRSSSAVVDNTGALINREEYTPYGETIFGSFAMKRYRFTGKERDEESGLYYHGARYYAPWIARWTSCDPVGVDGGTQLYCYAFNNPVRFHDPDGCLPAPYEIADAWAKAEPIQELTGENISNSASELGDVIGGAIVDALPPDNLGGILAAALVKTVCDVGGGVVATIVDPGFVVRGVMRFGLGTAQGVNDIEAGNTFLGVSRIVGEGAQGVGYALGGVNAARAYGVPGTYRPAPPPPVTPATSKPLASPSVPGTGKAVTPAGSTVKTAAAGSTAKAAKASGSAKSASPHGNSRSSSKPHHVYEIIDNENPGVPYKVGISGRPLNKNGTSPRAATQVNKLNKANPSAPGQPPRFSQRVIAQDMPNRTTALSFEQYRVNTQNNALGAPGPGNVLPRPNQMHGPGALNQGH
ncbi:MAG TPA: RHS repeat-associated core domain-containing protein [Pyrinomonadaceae bacterium]|nr:RHS repeat-associated core domain-containing protein [Pyrinomonadaceae bacterium]